MSLGLLKKISSSSGRNQVHSYENVPAIGASSNRQNERKHYRNHKEDYINVQFEDKNEKHHLAIIEEARQQPKEVGATASAVDIVCNIKSRVHQELAKSNWQELTQASEGKSQRVHRRTDSDTSISDITNGSESPDSKKRELEHYNRLKLDLSCPPRNKKALKGIKILTNGKQHQSLQLALHENALFKQKQQIANETRDSNTTVRGEKQNIPMIDYKKEGHINQLLSVTGQPIRRSRSFVPSSSGVTDDDYEVHANDNLHVKADRISEATATRRRSNSFGDIETMKAVIQDSNQFLKNASLTRPHSPPTHQIDKSGRHANTDTTDQPNDTAPATSNCNGVSFCGAIETTTFTHDGGQYTSEVHGTRISVPRGAVKKHTMLNLQIGVALQGPFSFPDTKRPVSPIVWLGVNPKIKLKKPIEITVPHFVKTASQSTSEKLTFLKAASKSTSGRKKHEEKYHFSEVAENDQRFNRDSQGTVHVLSKDFHFFCVAKNMSNSTLTANYCLLPAIPRQVGQATTWKVHYYIIYLLKTYIHVSTCT